MSRHRRKERGQSLVELAIMAPVILLVLLICVDLGRVFMGWVNVTNMVRIGANYAALNPKGFQDGDSGVIARYRELMTKDAEAINCDLPYPLPPPTFSGYDLGDTVLVDLTCDFELLTPIISGFVDEDGVIAVPASATFNVRSGSVGNLPVNPPQITPPPTGSPPPSSMPTPAATPDPSASASLPPVDVSFYGLPDPAQVDASGGGPAGSPNESQIVVLRNMRVDFTNETSGTRVSCLWDFGDGSTASDCSNQVSRMYTARGTYSVTLTVNGVSHTRTDYVLVACKVPDLHDQRKNNVSELWGTGTNGAGFTGGITYLGGNSNYVVKYQDPVSGIVNPPGGCAATLTVGP